ncbi:hypothetical protein [Paracoccus jiaweipingae]|uniref:hypothetical protein n=1 Tax=unclassified Paracoccus (in: a-proteobacteria) TaxID=2688777 RepID=UPI00378BE693
MILFSLKRSTAIVTLMALAAAPLAGVAQAQTQPRTPAQVQGQLPPALMVEGLRDIHTAPARRGGTRVTGKLADGSDFRAMLTPDGQLAMIGSDDGALPRAMLEAVLPQALRDDAMLAQIATIHAVMQADARGTMVMGKDADGQHIRIGFDPSGKLAHFSRGDDGFGGKKGYDRKGHKDHKGRKDHKEHRGWDDDDRSGDDRKGGKWGGRSWGDDDDDRPHDRRGSHMGQGDGPAMGGPRNDDGPRNGDGNGAGQGMGNGPRMGQGAGQGAGGAMGQPPAPMPDDAIRQAARDAGYTDLGAIDRAGPRGLIAATNPQGEAVTVEIAPNGRILRETAR